MEVEDGFGNVADGFEEEEEEDFKGFSELSKGKTNNSDVQSSI